MNATVSPRMGYEVEQQVGNLAKMDEEYCGTGRRTGKAELKLKKELLDIYARIHKGQQDFMKASVSPRERKFVFEDIDEQLNQTSEKRKQNVRVVDWIKCDGVIRDEEAHAGDERQIENSHHDQHENKENNNETENAATPKKDPPCFRRLAFNKADIEKPFCPNRLAPPLSESEKVIGDYIIGRQIGEGAYAVVKDGVNRKTGEKVAIKVYDVKRLKGGHKAKAVEREIKLLKKMSHENVVGFFEAFRTVNHIYVVMEYISGMNLRAYIRGKDKKRLSEEEAKDLFNQLLEGIAYCHRLEIAHRDIKLENLLVEQGGTLKIIDFGFSTCFPSSQKMKIFCGTPSYMAPEIVAKREYSGPPADIWAMGVLLYATLTGSFPFKGNAFQSYKYAIGSSDKDLYKRIMCGKFEVPDFLSKEAKDILQSMINVNPDKRPTASELLNHHWIKGDEIWSPTLCEADIQDSQEECHPNSNNKVRIGRNYSEIPPAFLERTFLDEDALLSIVLLFRIRNMSLM